MSCFQSNSTTLTSAPLDPSKHPYFTRGMVLKVDDFDQEFAYLAGRDQWLARDLLGYGTICGLQVKIEPDTKGPRVAVAPGAALNPKGQLIRVTSAQCAYLNDWLAIHRQEITEQLGSPPGGVVDLFLVLCYRDCPVDPMPIPSELCRTVEESMAPSRLKDDFKLALTWQAPDQREEDAIQDFIAWLRQVEISDAPGDATLEQFLQTIRASASTATSPPASPPDFMYGSPPASIHIHPANICDYLRAGFRVWTTELRPQWRGISKSCTGIPDEECVLLGQITIPIIFWSGNWVVDSSGTVVINEEKRPYLIHLRMLQQWLSCGWKGTARSPANSVVAEMQFSLSDNAGSSEEYSRADHTHGTPPEPVLDGEVTGNIGDTRVAKIQEVPIILPASPPNIPQEGDVLTIQSGTWQAAPVPVPELEGEVTGNIGDTRVAKIQEVPVILPSSPPNIPQEDDVLTIKSGNWQAAPMPFSAGDSVESEITFNKIPNRGTVAQFSRADHTHGTPPDPIPAHKIDLNAHDLKGEITGFIGITKVAKIQEISVVPNIPLEPGTNEGKVLTIKNNQWQAAPPPIPKGDFIERPTGSGKYFIVAAGIVKGKDIDASASYNKLNVKSTTKSRLVISFNGYKKPDDSFKYIAKIFMVTNDKVKMPIITFDSYQSQGINMKVIDGTNPAISIKKDDLDQLEFMIEVSRFEP